MNLTVESTQNKEVIDITEKINNFISGQKISHGLVALFVTHTTAALTTSEVGEGTEEDLLEVVQKIIPKINFRHGHNPAHAPDHMIGSIIGPSLTLPIEEGKLVLGIWQKAVLLEMNGPRTLNIICKISPD